MESAPLAPLKETIRPSPTATDAFLYDNQGNRIAQQSVQNGTTTTTVYVGNLEQVATTARADLSSASNVVVCAVMRSE